MLALFVHTVHLLVISGAIITAQMLLQQECIWVEVCTGEGWGARKREEKGGGTLGELLADD